MSLQIAVDIEGGDDDPLTSRTHRSRAVEALAKVSSGYDEGITFVAVGDEPAIKQELDKYDHKDNIEFEHQPVAFPMDKTIKDWRLNPSTIKTLADMLHSGAVHAFTSDGHSGATVYYPWRKCKPFHKKIKPSIVARVPRSLTDDYFITDVGAIKESTPQDIVHSTLLGLEYLACMYGITDAPHGAFQAPQVQEALSTLSSIDNFVGELAPDQVYETPVKLIAIDGFRGNIYLKLLEALGNAIMSRVKRTRFFDRIFNDEFLLPYFSPTIGEGFAQFANLSARTTLLASGETESDVLARVDQAIHKSERAQIGVLSNGEEDTKGDAFAQALRASLPDSIYVEPADVIRGSAKRNDLKHSIDILATDQATADLFEYTLTSCERRLSTLIKDTFTFFNMIRYGASKLVSRITPGPVGSLKAALNPENYSGAPVLGIKGYAVINHGASTVNGIESSIRFAIKYAQSKYIERAQEVADKIKQGLQRV